MGISPFGGFGNLMFSIMPVIVILGFVFVFGIFIVCAVHGASQWKRNNEAPVLTVEATLMAKRADVQHFHHGGAGTDQMMHHTSSSTTYYVTFEVASGDRMEFQVRDTEYGLLVERDTGKLTFQGTRYLGFVRSMNGAR